MNNTNTELRTVLFDLDGTLADTAPDLAATLNALRDEQGLPPLPFAAIRPVVSHGSTALVRLGFGEAMEEAMFNALRQRFLEIYAQCLAVETRLFPGMEEVLAYIENHGLNWGVVTNKPAFLTQPLLDLLNLTARSACIVSGDTLPQRKPHPAPLLHACHLAGSTAGQCLYIGDAERDIAAGRNAGMHTMVAMFGYIGSEDMPEQWNADALVQTPVEIISWIEQNFCAT